MIKDTPEKAFLRSEVRRYANLQTSSKRKIKSLQQAQRRLKKKVAQLKDVIEDLKKNRIMLDDNASLLENLAGSNRDLLKRQLAKKTGMPLPIKYSPELRAFALTLHFYSPRAYSYVRQVFDTCLPHPRTLTKWYQSTDGRPGFSKEALAALQMKVTENDKTGYPTLCSLIVDEMSIRRHLEWDGRKVHGHIDMGSHAESDDLPVAKDAFVPMVVSINGRWKLPLGYFLVDGLGGEQRANLVLQCLKIVQPTTAKIVSLTCDGAAANISMLRSLGCSFDVPGMKTCFPHPETAEPIYVFLDACHMLKLLRNALGVKKVLVDGDGGKVRWKLIEDLHKVQHQEGLHLANKLTQAHVSWEKQPMKVSLAAQVFSISVATALAECRNLNVPGFHETQPTERFIRYVNNTFDILNSRSMHQRLWKKALCEENIEDVRVYLLEAAGYFSSMKEFGSGQLMIHANRRTGFLGFLACINSALGLYDCLIQKNKFLKYLPTIKVSQDHLELFFGAIRSFGRCNDNPTTRQFEAAFKRLIIHNEIRDVTSGNCLPLEHIKILSVSSSIEHSSVDVINWTSPRRSLADDTNATNTIVDEELALLDHSYGMNHGSISEMAERTIAYIAGFVVRHLKATLKCPDCVAALTLSAPQEATYSLIRRKSMGGLTYPSQDVIAICKQSEKTLRRSLAVKPTLSKNFYNEAVLGVLHSFIGKKIFNCLDDHMLDNAPMDNHFFHLVRSIAQKYLNIRLHAWSKSSTEDLHKQRCRQLHTKLTQFKGQ